MLVFVSTKVLHALCNELKLRIRTSRGIFFSLLRLDQHNRFKSTVMTLNGETLRPKLDFDLYKWLKRWVTYTESRISAL